MSMFPSRGADIGYVLYSHFKRLGRVAIEYVFYQVVAIEYLPRQMCPEA